MLDFDSSKTKQPIPSGGLCPQTPCFRDSPLGLAPSSDIPISAPLQWVFACPCTSVVQYIENILIYIIKISAYRIEVLYQLHI